MSLHAQAAWRARGSGRKTSGESDPSGEVISELAGSHSSLLRCCGSSGSGAWLSSWLCGEREIEEGKVVITGHAVKCYL